MTKRLERAIALLHQEISRFLPTLLMDKNYGLVTVSQVELTADLGQATVWVSLLGNVFTAEAVLSYLNHQTHAVQVHLNQVLYWRRTPKLVFRLDQSNAYVEHIERTLAEIKKEEPESNSYG